MNNYSGSFTQSARQDSGFGVPVGTVFPWPAPIGTALPTGYLLCDGSAVTRALYPELFAVTGVTYGDGTTTPSGATPISSGFGAGIAFNLPDLRGTFMRGVDNTGGAPGAAGRDPGARLPQATGGGTGGGNPGTTQNDAIQGHAHEGWATGTETGGSGGPLYGGGAHNFGNMMQTSQADLTNGAPQIAGETRPISISCQFIVRAF